MRNKRTKKGWTASNGAENQAVRPGRAKAKVAKSEQTSPASKSTLKRRPKRNTYSNKKDMASLSIRLYPDQDEAVRQMAFEADRSRNAAVWFIIDWYLRGVDAGTQMAPKADSREDTLIYKQPAFQFRADKQVIDRLWELAEKYEYRSINPFIIGIVDEYLSEHSNA